MKTECLIRLIRSGKEIVIYVKDSDWNKVPNLDFIQDIEVYNQPESSKREDINFYGMKAEIKKDGLCYFDDGIVIDPSQPIDDAVLRTL